MHRKGVQKVVIYIMLVAIILSGVFMGVAGLGGF
ncbi:stressosome-associated protein Prli42 [Alkalicoccobacillus porphyridii]|nr:stressosome-associated protein Prli42 [Alkalicoccobacillus porphyridii]